MSLPVLLAPQLLSLLTGYQSFPQPEENAQHVNRDMVADEITKGVLY